MKIIILSRVKKCQFSWICNHHSMRSRLLTMNSGTHHASSPFLALFSRNYILTHACMHKIVCIGFWLAKLQNHIATVQSPPPNNTHLTPQQLDIVLTEAPLNTILKKFPNADTLLFYKADRFFSYFLLPGTSLLLVFSVTPTKNITEASKIGRSFSRTLYMYQWFHSLDWGSTV